MTLAMGSDRTKGPADSKGEASSVAGSGRILLAGLVAPLPARRLALVAGSLAILRDGLALTAGLEDAEDLRRRFAKAETRADTSFRPPPTRALLQRLRLQGRVLAGGRWPTSGAAERMLITHSLELASRREGELSVSGIDGSGIALELPPGWTRLADGVSRAVRTANLVNAGNLTAAREELVEIAGFRGNTQPGDDASVGAGLLLFGVENIAEVLRRLDGVAISAEVLANP